MLTPIALHPTAAYNAPPRLDFNACGQPGGQGDAYDVLLARLRQEAVPYSALLELTHVCNLDCVMCYNVPLDQPELTTAEWLDVLEQLARAGTLRLTLSGGEILTRRDFFTIAGHARALGFALELKTNATLLTPENVDRIAALDPVQVDISLLGATDATFDDVAGSRSTLTRVLRGAHLLLERGVYVKMNTLILDLNLHEREQMVKLAWELGVEYDQVIRVNNADDGRDMAGNRQLSYHQMADVMVAGGSPFSPHEPGPGSRTCGVGQSSCLISPYGEVYPCVELRISAGNIRREPFDQIWSNGAVFQRLRSQHIFDNLPECRVCLIRGYCRSRCSGAAWKQRGDLFGADLVACEGARARFIQCNPGNDAPLTPLQRKHAVLTIEANDIKPAQLVINKRRIQ